MPDRFLGDADRALVDDAQWVAEVEPEILRLHSAGDAARALQLLRERRGPDGAALLPALEVETLEALGRLDEAARSARDAMRAAAARFDVSAVATFALQDARLLERSTFSEHARQVLSEALDAVQGPTVDRLRLLVAWLGLARRHGIPDRGALSPYGDETVRLARAIGPRGLAEVPGLLRDVAAEVGEHAPDLLDSALGTVGLDALAGGSVPKQLEALAASTDRRGTVIDLMQLAVNRPDNLAGQIDFHEVINQPRGRTGRALEEVLSMFGDTAAGLRTAVAADYQRESDAALMGESLATQRRWSPEQVD